MKEKNQIGEWTFICNTPSFKNSREAVRSGGRVFLRLSTNAQIAKQVYKEEFKPLKEEIGTLEGLHEISFFFYRNSKRRFDYINIAQGILDGLVNAEILKDDSADNVIPSFEGYEFSGKQGFRMKIFKMVETKRKDAKIENETL